MKSIVTLILAFVIYVGCAMYVYHDGNLDMDHSPMTELRVTSRGPVPKGLVNAGPSALKVVFRAFDNDYELDMKINNHLYHEKFPKSIQRHWTYTGDITLNEWLHGHVTFTFERDDYHSNFHGTMYVDKTMYQISHADKHNDFADTEHRMILSKHGEGKDWDASTPPDLHENAHLHASRRRLNLVYFTDCWPDQEKYVKGLAVGYTIDRSLETRVWEYMANEAGTNDEKMRRFVAQVNADSNVIYHNQLDVILTIMDIKMVGQAGTWQNTCPPDIGDYLNKLTTWRNDVTPNDGGMWKALTNCFPPPGTVGYAYVGTLCRQAATGVSNYMNIASGGTWGVNAHEAGHIFGARHSFENGQGSTGGIMDYGDGYFQDVYQFNPLRKNEVCGVLTNIIPGNVMNCWSTIGQNDGAKYNWRKSGTFTECLPTFGKFKWQSITYDCEVYVNGEKRDGNMAECDVADYPWGEIKACASNEQAAACGNNWIEDGEECEQRYDGDCCVDCKWSTEGVCAGADSHIDATFMDDNGVLYVVSRQNVYRYSQGQDKGLDDGYPKTLKEEWPGVTDEFVEDGIGGIVRKPTGNVMWMFKGRNVAGNTPRDIKYLEISYATGTLIKERSLDRQILTDLNYNAGGQSIVWEDDVGRDDPVSYTMDFFRSCGGVDAGLSMPSKFYLFCESMFVEFDWNMDVKTLRPVNDLRIGFSWETKLRGYVSSAYYNWHDQASLGKARFWNSNYYIDWWGFRTVGLESMAYPLTYQPVVVTAPPTTTDNGDGGDGGDGGGSDGGGSDGGSDGGGSDGGNTGVIATGTTTDCTAPCATCRVGLKTSCNACIEGYEIFGSICLEKSNDININFGTTPETGDVQWLAGGVNTLTELVGSNTIVSGAGIAGSAAARLDSSTRIDFNPISKRFLKFQLEAWFQADCAGNHAANSTFFTFMDTSTPASTRIRVSLLDPDCEKNPHMTIEFPSGNAPISLRCITEATMKRSPDSTLSEWTQFILKVSAGTVDCCIQGTCIAASFEGANEESLNFVIGDWYLGADQDGLIGHVDAIKLEITTPDEVIEGIPKKTLVFVVVGILIFFIIIVLGFKYRSDFLNPCGADSHDRTINSSGSSKPPTTSSSWAPPGSGPPRPPEGNITTMNHLPKAPPLATNTSFTKAPPSAPVWQKPSGLPPKRSAVPPKRPGLPTIGTPKRPGAPPKRTFPRKPPGAPGKGGPPPPPMKNLW